MTDRKKLLRNAKTGNYEAQLELACHYDFEFPKDRRRAIYWYQKSATQGNAEAQNFFAECLRDGVGTKISKREAFKWFKLAAEQGESDAQVSLGYSYF